MPQPRTSQTPHALALAALAALLTLALAACGDADDAPEGDANASTSTNSGTTSTNSSTTSTNAGTTSTNSGTTSTNGGTTSTSSGTTSTNGTTTAADAGGGDAGGGDAGDDTGAGPDATPDAAPDAPDASAATLSGDITRTTDPVNGAVGPLYVAVFDRNPILDAANAQAVGQTIIELVDFSDPATAVPYTIRDIPVRPEPYFMIAFFDDNQTATVDNPAPDSGDLVTLENFGPVQVTVAQPGEVTRNLVLNVAIP